MKSLSTFNQEAIEAFQVSPIRLVVIDFGGGVYVRLCSRVFGDAGAECEIGGQIYEPLLLSYDTIRTGAIDPITYETYPGETSITIDNNTPMGGYDRFSELLAANNGHYALVIAYDTFEGTTSAADMTMVFYGTLEDFLELTADRVTVACSGYSLDIANRFRHTIINPTTYPSADPDDLGKMAPQVYGSALRVPAIAIDAGGKSTIISAMMDSSPGNGGTLEISDGSAMPTGAFIAQVDSEQISIASRSDNTLTLAASGARGYNSTTAVDHDTGSGIAEIQTEYIYLVADHPVLAINNIYVDNVRQTSGFTAYTGQNGDEKAGYLGKAVIVFTTLPTFEKQINVSVNDTIDVSDGISVADTIGVNDGIGVSDTIGVADTITVSDTIGVDQGLHNHAANQEIIVWPFDSADITGGSPTYPQYLIDGSMVTQCGFRFSGDTVTLSTVQYAQFMGNPSHYRLGIKMVADGGGNIRLTYNSKTLDITAVGTQQSGWYSVDSSLDTWTEVNAKTATVSCTSAGASTNAIVQAWIEYKYTPAISGGPATGVAKTGSASKGGTATKYGWATKSGSATKTGAASKSGTVTKVGTVTISGNSTAETVIGERIAADVDGFMDNGVGTYTGTPYALIERPDHIARHILLDRCLLTSGRIDSTSYNTAGALYASNSFVLGFAILQRPNVRALLNRVATQAKSLELWEAGEHKLMFISDTETTDKTIDATRIDLNQIYLKHTERIDLINQMSARYARHWSGYDDDIEADQGLVIASDATSITAYGTLEGDPLSLPYVPGVSQAQAVLDWRLSNQANPRLIIEFAGGFYLSDLEHGDVIEFKDIEHVPAILSGELATNASDELITTAGDALLWDSEQWPTFAPLTDALLGMVALESDQFRIIDINRRADAAIQIAAIKI